MAIATQYPYIDQNGYERKNLIKTYSDLNFRIMQNPTGYIYDEAIDVYPTKYFYTETNEKIDDEEEIDYETAYNNLAQEVMSDE